jgi:hypothetical protein
LNASIPPGGELQKKAFNAWQSLDATVKIARSSHSHASPRSPARAPFTSQAPAALRGKETIGRPLGSPAFLDRLAALTGRDPRSRKRGPKPMTRQGV